LETEYQRDCPEDDILPFAMHGFCTSVHTSTGATPHHPSLYNVKVEPHMKVRVPSTEVPMKAKFNCRMSWTATSKG